MLRKFIDLIRRCLRLALPYGRAKFFWIVVVMLLNGLMQMVGVVSIFPFLALAANPKLFRESQIGASLLSHLPPLTDRELLIYTGTATICFLFVANLLTLLSEVIRNRYAHGFGHWLRSRLIADIAARPYGYFLTQNTAGLLQKVLGDVGNFVQNVFLPLTEAGARLVTLVLLGGFVCLTQPFIALAGVALLGAMYLGVFLLVRPKTQEMGEKLRIHNRGIFVAAHQMMTGIKPVLVHGKQEYFFKRFNEHSSKLAPLFAKMPLYQNGPRYVIEPVLFGSMVAIVIWFATQGRSLAEVMPELAVIALAGYRMMPAAQLLYSQLSSITAWAYTLGELERELHLLLNESDDKTPKPKGTLSPALGFARNISLAGVTFQYPGAPKPVIDDFSLEIPRGRSIGIVGTTGSGKSTLVDLILGLHRPQSGRLLVDGVELTDDKLQAWRAKIGYVPQDIFLLDDTLEANIAFGIPAEEIDGERLRKAARGAQILDFIEKELPQGFATEVGERGVRLSGGQRQRIGLARALYHEPEILILDEATSALDNETEAAVMKTINALHGNLTLIIIAHRLSTIEGCDEVVRLQSSQQSES